MEKPIVTPITKKIPEVPEDIQKSFDEFIKKYGDAKTEHSRVIGIDGNVYDKTSKSRTYTKIDYAGTVEGSSTIHNHPIASTFSPEDIKGTLLYGREYEVVVDKDNIYTLINLNPTKTPQDGINARWGFVNEYRNAIRQFEEESLNARRAYIDTLSDLPRDEQRRLMRIYDENRVSVYDRMNEWLSENAERYDFVYTKTPRNRTIAEPLNDKPIIEITQNNIDRVKRININDDVALSDKVQEVNKEILTKAMKENNNAEVTGIFTLDNKNLGYCLGEESKLTITGEADKVFSTGRPCVLLHNHPRGSYFSTTDLNLLLGSKNVEMLGYISNNGNIGCLLSKTSNFDIIRARTIYARMLKGVDLSKPEDINKVARKIVDKLEKEGLLNVWQ